jgi:hypothetical protein
MGNDSHAVSHKLIVCQEQGNRLRVNVARVQDLLTNSITVPNGVCGLNNCLAMVFVDGFSILSTLSVTLLVRGCSEQMSSSTGLETRAPFKKTAVWLRVHFPKVSRSISKGFASGFTELYVA